MQTALSKIGTLFSKSISDNDNYSGDWELVIFPNTIDFMATEMNYETLV